jgi:hypothetical protein
MADDEAAGATSSLEAWPFPDYCIIFANQKPGITMNTTAAGISAEPVLT